MPTNGNYQTLIAQLEKNNPSLTYLDFKNIHLTLLQLEEIANKIQNNNFVGHIRWGIVPHTSEKLLQRIESKIVSNNQNYKHHPNDFIHGLLSSHVYIDSKNGDMVNFAGESKNNEQIKI
jgi:hypothetical protein